MKNEEKNIESIKKADDCTIKMTDGDLVFVIPDNENNRAVIAKMKKMPLNELHIWKDIYEKMIACEKCLGEKPTKEYHYSPALTLKYYEHEIKLREQRGEDINAF